VVGGAAVAPLAGGAPWQTLGCSGGASGRARRRWVGCPTPPSARPRPSSGGRTTQPTPASAGAGSLPGCGRWVRDPPACPGKRWGGRVVRVAGRAPG